MLETFTETRSTAYVYAVYRGGAVEGPTMGAAPGPWDMEVTPDRLFHDHAKKVPVPFTSVVQVVTRHYIALYDPVVEFVCEA
jgi:hypothetical protein